MNRLICVMLFLCTFTFISCRENPTKEEMTAFIEAMNVGDQDKQLIEIDKLLKKYPNSFITYSNRLTILLSKKDIDNAITNCLKMIDIQPENALIKVKLAMLYIIQNDNKSVTLLEEATTIMSNNYNNEKDVQIKKTIAINMFLPLVLLNRRDEAENMLHNYVDSLSEYEIQILELIRKNNALEISKIINNMN
jgi:tetratricopeptide (TPR) repeat protein